MQIPLEFQIKNIPKTDDLEDYVNRRVDTLEKFCDYISGCRVIINTGI